MNKPKEPDTFDVVALGVLAYGFDFSNRAGSDKTNAKRSRTAWDILVPSRASLAGINMLMLAANGSDKIRKALLSTMVPRRFFRLNGDLSKPVVGIDALEAFYVIRLKRQGNFFIPIGGDQHEPMIEH